MQKPILIHNPRCSKSRQLKEILDSRNVDYITIDYIRDGIDESLLLVLPKLLNLSYEKIIRHKEFCELNLSKKIFTDKDWVKILLAHPLLLERPIFIKGDKAIIARPPELVLPFL